MSWAFVTGRAAEVAAALDGRASAIYVSRFSNRRLVLLRYMLQAVRTVAALLRERPRAVIVTNPPVFPGMICYAYARIVRVPIALDSHTASFGLKGDPLSTYMLPVHRWLARRVDAVLVTGDELGGQVLAWGGKPLVVHEAPPRWTVEAAPPLGERPAVLFVGVFAGDEPVQAVVAAARLLPDCDISITGDLRKAPAGLVDAAPGNVRFVGFRPEPEYRQLVEQSNIVMSLTTEPVSVMRAAYEAVYARRPLVLSDWPLLRELFPFGVAVSNDAAAIAGGVRSVLADYGGYLRCAEDALHQQTVRWEDQMQALRNALAIDPGDRDRGQVPLPANTRRPREG